MFDSSSPLYLSLKVGIVATLIVVISAVALAALLDKKEFKGKHFIESLILVPMVLPPTVIGFALVFLFGRNGPFGILLENLFGIHVYFSWLGAVIASVVVSFPLMYQSAKAAFQKVDSRWQNIGRTMGASEWKVFKDITIPLAWPGLLAGVILTFSRAIGEFGATLMIAGYIPGETDTLPIAIYFAVESGQMEQAIIWVVVLFSFGLMIVYWLLYLNNRKTSKWLQ
ncbi:molybdate ABC transporter permease subunit [Alkalibacillus aidingensis]|uniref:molybdate ABC transporter permease subunit n=1 Tax=Alkalibacillus aidingensis TaxID=2747607 RepID=UPI001660E7EA|nr:molybdate ABC transporter permease subunit [Alkalibacillus aidingensis]